MAGPAGTWRCASSSWRSGISPVLQDYAAIRRALALFLAGSSMLDHWCAVADLDPAWMIARANQLTTASGGQGPSGTMGTKED